MKKNNKKRTKAIKEERERKRKKHEGEKNKKAFIISFRYAYNI